MRKKIILFILLSCLLTSCINSKTSPSLLLDNQFDTVEFLPEYDFRNEFGKWRQLYESEQAYYLFSDTNPFLHYYDKESGISGVLCGKPECNHSDTSCNAYLAGGSSLMYYDGYIYSVQSVSSVVDGVSQNLIRLTQEVLGDAEQEAKTILEVVGNDYFYQLLGTPYM